MKFISKKNLNEPYTFVFAFIGTSSLQQMSTGQTIAQMATGQEHCIGDFIHANDA